jgi:hypothetical protein
MSDHNIVTMLIEELREFRKATTNERIELHKTLNAILEFIGDSRRDRIGLHETLEEHHERITKLETGDQKKKAWTLSKSE